MSEHYDCKICDKSIKIISKKKHLDSKEQYFSDKNTVARYYIKNPDFFQIENLLQSYVLNHDKKFGLYSFMCQWKLNFSDTIINIKLPLRLNFVYYFNLRTFLLSKLGYYEKRGLSFSHKIKMKVVFISNPRNRT